MFKKKLQRVCLLWKFVFHLKVVLLWRIYKMWLLHSPSLWVLFLLRKRELWQAEPGEHNPLISERCAWFDAWKLFLANLSMCIRRISVLWTLSGTEESYLTFTGQYSSWTHTALKGLLFLSSTFQFLIPFTCFLWYSVDYRALPSPSNFQNSNLIVII